MGLCTPIPDGPRSRTQLPAGTRNQLVYDAVRHRVKRVHYVVRHQMAGREGFEPSRELYTPYPLSRRVLSATQPPPRQGGPPLDSIEPMVSPYLASDGSPRRTRRAPDVGAGTQDGVRYGARSEEQGLVHAGR